MSDAKNLKEAILWCGQAMSDMEVGRIVFGHQKWSYACFLSQQSSEKSLKALYYFLDRDIERRHGLSELFKGLPEETQKALGSLHDDLLILDQYYLPTRYPDALGTGNLPSESYTRKQAEDSLASARKVLEATLFLTNITIKGINDPPIGGDPPMSPLPISGQDLPSVEDDTETPGPK